jgi:aminobenzoyl-glutamate transport protein
MANAEGTGEVSNRGGLTQRLLDGIERVGNKVPNPVLMFLYLLLFVMVLSHVLYVLDVRVTEQIAEPVPVSVQPDYYEDVSEPSLVIPSEDPEFTIAVRTIAVQSLLTADGVRFMFTRFVANFQGFGAMAVTIIALLGAGIAEHAGLMAALIRKLVQVAPRRWFTFILVFVGVLASIAADAGYLILVPLGAAAFLSLGRHPLAGMAAAYGGVGGIFMVNLLITPTDSMLNEVTNQAIGLVGGSPLALTANLYFAAASSVVMAVVATLVTERIIEPRLGVYRAAETDEAQESEGVLSLEEVRGLKWALYGFLAVSAFMLLITLPPGAPLRALADSDSSPLLESLLFIIFLVFLTSGICYGFGAGTFKSKDDVIAAGTKTLGGLGGLIFMFLMISQFIAFFNYSNMPRVAAIAMADGLEQMNVGAIPLLVGMIVVIMLLDTIIPGALAKWAIFAPVFVPLFIRLGVAPQTVFAAYRVGDSPVNVVTPLMVYLPFIVTVAQKYQKDAGIGTIVALMLPYTLVLSIAWILFFMAWFWLGLPLGPGYPVTVS